MEGRGKRSAASLQVVKSAGVSAVERPDPPPYLTTEQRGIWVHVVNSMPADWFKPESHEILANYCRHAVNAFRVSSLVEELLSGDQSDDWLSTYDKLLRMQERESSAVKRLGTCLRLTPHAQYSHKKKLNQPSLGRPWD